MEPVCEWGCVRHWNDLCEFQRLKSWQHIVSNVGVMLLKDGQQLAARFVWSRLLEQDPSFAPAKFNLKLMSKEELKQWEPYHE